MFDIGWQELFIVAVLAIIVVGPKDLPKALKTVTIWVRKARSMAREFQTGVNDMVRESELDEFKKQALEDTSDMRRELEDSLKPTELTDALDVSDVEKSFETPKIETLNSEPEGDMTQGDAIEGDATQADATQGDKA